jgi:hypothetical protein
MFLLYARVWLDNQIVDKIYIMKHEARKKSEVYGFFFSFASVEAKLQNTALCVCVSEMLFLEAAINSQIGKTLHLLLGHDNQSCHRINLKSTCISCCHRQYYKATETKSMAFKISCNFAFGKSLCIC